MQRRPLLLGISAALLGTATLLLVRHFRPAPDDTVDYEAYLGQRLGELIAAQAPSCEHVLVITPELEAGRTSQIDKARLRGIRRALPHAEIHEQRVAVDSLAAQTGGEVLPVETYAKAIAEAPPHQAVISLVGTPARMEQLTPLLPEPGPIHICLAVYGESIQAHLASGLLHAAITSRPDIPPVDEILPPNPLHARFQLEFVVRTK